VFALPCCSSVVAVLMSISMVPCCCTGYRTGTLATTAPCSCPTACSAAVAPPCCCPTGAGMHGGPSMSCCTLCAHTWALMTRPTSASTRCVCWG
jgi:hypothetical protein